MPEIETLVLPIWRGRQYYAHRVTGPDSADFLAGLDAVYLKTGNDWYVQLGRGMDDICSLAGLGDRDWDYANPLYWLDNEGGWELRKQHGGWAVWWFDPTVSGMNPGVPRFKDELTKLATDTVAYLINEVMHH